MVVCPRRENRNLHHNQLTNHNTGNAGILPAANECHLGMWRCLPGKSLFKIKLLFFMPLRAVRAFLRYRASWPLRSYNSPPTLQRSSSKAVKQASSDYLARRNPLSAATASVGRNPIQYAERQCLLLSHQPPPRDFRYEPVAGPVGFVTESSVYAPPHQS